MARTKPAPAAAPLILIAAALIGSGCRTVVVHYEWSADRRHLVRVLEEGIDQHVERDGVSQPSFRAIGVESLRISRDGAHLAYPGMTAAGWEVVYDGERSRAWRGIGEVLLSDDGTHLAYAALDDGGWRIVHDGRLGPIVDAIMTNTLVFSPDGQRLAYVGARGGASHLFADGRSYGGFSLVGRPLFSSDSRHLAFVAARGRRVRVHLDGAQQRQFEEIVELRFSPDGSRLGYFGLREERWYPVIDGELGDTAELLASLTFSAGGRAAYLARDGGRWHLVLDGARIGSHERIDHRTLCFSAEEPRFAAGDDDGWFVANGPRLGEITALTCAPSGGRYAYVGWTEDRAVVFEGEREVGRFSRADAPIFSSDGAKLAFLAADESGAFVQIAERRVGVPKPAFGTLALSEDGSHFALLSIDRERRALQLIVDGTAAKSFDFGEPAALLLKEGRPLPEDALRRWVEAELARHLEDEP